MWELVGNYEVFPKQDEHLPFKTGKQSAKYDSIAGSIHLRNENAKFITKALRGSLFVFGIEFCSSSLLFILPESFSKWDKSKLTLQECLNNLKRAYSAPPVVDKDLWVINYVGHPYQGAYFYNAVRSQNASVLQSSLFCLGHSMLWEYFSEAFYEQPSIQDLIVTPITGVFFGELAHRATLRMSRNGFTLGEKVLTILINPMYVLNNGFKPKTVKIKSGNL
jgi:hypothetical protein